MSNQAQLQTIEPPPLTARKIEDLSPESRDEPAVRSKASAERSHPPLERVDDPLSALRARVDDLDRKLVALLAERGRLAREIGGLKAERGLGDTDPAREAQVVRRAAEHARADGIDPEAVRRIYWRVIELSHVIQRG